MSEGYNFFRIGQDLIGETVESKDGMGTRRGVVRGVFLIHPPAGLPRLGLVLMLKEGGLATYSVGSFTVVKDEEAKG